MPEKVECEFNFTLHNPNWSTSDKHNRLFFEATHRNLTIVMVHRGHLFLNEVLDALSILRIPKGQTHGWLHRSDQNYFDFDVIRNSSSFGSAPSYTLTFAVEPNVYLHI